MIRKFCESLMKREHKIQNSEMVNPEGKIDEIKSARLWAIC